MGNIIDLTGKVYGRLTVISFSHTKQPKHRHYWNCICQCGNIHVAQSYLMRAGLTQSCGCLKKEAFKYSITHGESHRTKEYSAWSCMKSRCLNPNCDKYKWYGARGITIHPIWIESFEEFLKHVGRAPTPKHSLDRINNDGNYEPGNVKWSTHKEQCANRRSSKKYKYTVNDVFVVVSYYYLLMTSFIYICMLSIISRSVDSQLESRSQPVASAVPMGAFLNKSL